MSNDDLPPPPDNPFEDAPAPVPAEDAPIAAEADYRNLLIAEINQRMRVRTVAVRTALSVVVFMAVYAGISLWQVAFVDASRKLPWNGLDRTTALVLIVTPIISISTIIVMFLLGAFRRFKDDDMDKVDFRNLLSEAFKAMPPGN